MHKIVANLHLNDRADPGEAEDHHPNERAIPQPEEIRLIGRLWIMGWFLGNGDTFEQRMGLVSRQDRRLAFLDRVARDRMSLLKTNGGGLNIRQEIKIFVVFILASFSFANLFLAANETDLFNPLYHFVPKLVLNPEP